MFIIIFPSPPILGFFLGSSPDSYVYRFFKQTKEVRVIKTRTIHVPEHLTEVFGRLHEFVRRKDQIECDDYQNDTILVINSIYWGEFSEYCCNLRAAILRIDDLKHRSSAPLKRSSTLPFPIVLMHNNDEKQLEFIGKKL